MSKPLNGQELRDIRSEEFFMLKNIAEKIKFLLRYAILAPSTHNSQPWIFKIENSSCKIYADSKKYTIIEADPIKRDLYISLGTCIENLIIAAQYFGVYKNIIYSSGTDNEISEVFFDFNMLKTNNNYKPLLDAITHRVNKRGIFESRSIDKSIIEKIKKISVDHLTNDGIYLHTINEKEKIEKLAGLTRDGLEKAYERNSFRSEMSKWINNSFSGRKHGIPGYSLRMPALLSIIFPFIVKYFNIGKKLGQLNYVSFNSAPLVCLISSHKESPQIWLKIGQLAERLMLELNTQGLKTSIFVASIEMGFGKEVQNLIGVNNLPQFIFVSGYMSGHQKPTLRYSVEEKLV